MFLNHATRVRIGLEVILFDNNVHCCASEFAVVSIGTVSADTGSRNCIIVSGSNVIHGSLVELAIIS